MTLIQTMHHSNMKPTQIQFVKNHIIVHGEISRNYCLQRYISRLGAIMNKLKKEGLMFETERRNGDYVYKLLK